MVHWYNYNLNYHQSFMCGSKIVFIRTNNLDCDITLLLFLISQEMILFMNVKFVHLGSLELISNK